MRHPNAGLIAGITIALLAVGTGAAWWAYHRLKAPPVVSPPTAKESLQVPHQRERAQIYWLSGQEEPVKLQPYPLMLSQTTSDRQVMETALNRLLAGPQNPKEATAIPQGTKLLALSLTKGEIRVNLSQQFTTGGGSASMSGRLAQILYTATSIDTNSKVWLEVEGQPLTVLGGEGLEVAQPLSRRQFKQDFPL